MGEVRLDADQVRAAQKLGELIDRRGRPVRGHRGIYLHGRPGRGKTMVMDRFYAGVASDRKRRFHFHEFFARLHEAFHASGAIDKAVAALLGDARLVCFDEFHVHDIGDAMLIARLLDVLFARRMTLVVTSNYPPEELLPNPLFHERFLPAIARITAHLDVVSIDGPLDYRTRTDGTRTGRTGFAAGAYLIEADRPAPATDAPVRIGARLLHAVSTTDDALTIEFAALCGTPTSAADYVELAQRFRHWTIRDVPPLREVPPDWAMRFVNVVDVLYDADRELTVRARVPLAELVDGVRGVPDISRIASRLCEISQLAPSSV
ncbi:cell division protein ZapE [Nocardia tenerifensis]|uniref:Cell division protein ZapE n=1 Tax=Nocardia tenerifensis TaxID=228006 RepID=A0A318K5D7_9NOCA|nr:cell division protein ZapE [Nocardia tenerifensis]PXX67031.1 cell division protein ZapE [Nocardia tenerifensis]